MQIYGSLNKTTYWPDNPALSREDVSYYAGWLGDAVLKENNGTTSLNNDDYCADLDAENIYRIILNSQSYLVAYHLYYHNLSADNNRADVFLSNISFNTIKTRVFGDLVDTELLIQIEYEQNNGNPIYALYLTSLLNNEQYHWDIIQSSCPDSYDFLKSLEDRLAFLAHYQ